jgi:hypothetical protein
VLVFMAIDRRAATPEGEWPTPGWDHAIAQSEKTDRAFRKEQARTSPPSIPDERAVEVRQPFSIGLTTYAVGTRFDRDHVLVRMHPQVFGTPRRPLVK